MNELPRILSGVLFAATIGVLISMPILTAVLVIYILAIH